MWTILWSVEFVALFRVLSILQLSVCMPMRWLTANCGDLAQYKFGYTDIAGALDLLDVCFKAIALDGSLLLDDDHMMTIFDTLANSKCFSLFLVSWHR